MPSQKIESGHTDTVHDVAMDYYGKRLATASSDCTIKITGVSNSSSQLLATISGHQGPVWQVAWAHPKFGSLLASCSSDGKVIIWKEGTQNEWSLARVFDDHKASVNAISWAPHELGLCLACGSSDGNISIFTARSEDVWETSRIDQAHPVGVTSVSWAPSTAPGSLVGSDLLNSIPKLASAGCDNTVKVWKMFDGTWKLDCFPALQMHTDWVRDVAWAPNLGLPKSTIASASEDGRVICLILNLSYHCCFSSVSYTSKKVKLMNFSISFLNEEKISYIIRTSRGATLVELHDLVVPLFFDMSMI